MANTLGLALGSGAARGWAHVGVLRELAEAGLEPQVISGCSVGALVGGAHLLGRLEDFEAWARELSPLSTMQHFALEVSRGGLIRADAAFDAFRDTDTPIETLNVRFGVVATDLSTGETAWLTEGSIIDAARASSAIPILMQAVDIDGRWLVDGALSDPVPVALARDLGADVVVAVDLNGTPKVLDRFAPRPPAPPAVREPQERLELNLPPQVAKIVGDTRAFVETQIQAAKARAKARPQLFETALAVSDIYQMQLTAARAAIEPADITLKPDMRDALPNAFDRADEFIERGRRAALDAAPAITTALKQT